MRVIRCENEWSKQRGKWKKRKKGIKAQERKQGRKRTKNYCLPRSRPEAWLSRGIVWHNPPESSALVHSSLILEHHNHYSDPGHWSFLPCYTSSPSKLSQDELSNDNFHWCCGYPERSIVSSYRYWCSTIPSPAIVHCWYFPSFRELVI